MRQRLHRRLHQLEKVSANARRQFEAASHQEDSERAIRRVNLFLRIRDVQKSPAESLMEALARALEISPRELRAQLLSDIDPIHKFFTDHGFFHEMERRKAAGKWPGGGKKERECHGLIE